MGAPRARRHDPRRRDRIDACLDVVAEHGVAGTSHRRVAAAADVPLGSMTYHFEGMDELLREAFGRFAQQLATTFEERMVNAVGVEEAERAVARLITHDVFATQRDLVLTHELYTVAAREPAYRTLTNDWMRRSRRALERHFDPTTTRLLDALIEGLTIHRALDTEPSDEADVLDAVRRITAGARGAEKERRMSTIDDPTPAGPTLADRRARVAVSAMFLTNGALYANLLPRYPEIKADLDLTNTVYGLTVIAFPAGAIISGLGAAVLIRRFGSAHVAVVGTLLTAAAVVGAGLSPTLALLMVMLFLGGAMDALTDVGQNAHGLRVQRRYGRSIFNSFHALWSVGAVVGGAMAAGAIALDVPLGLHLGISGVLFSVVALVALRYRLPGRNGEAREAVAAHDDAPDAAAPGRGTLTRGRLVLMLSAFVLVAIGGAVVEEAANSWAALYLSGSLGTAGAVAATGFIAFMAAEFLGRATGDRFVDRFGQRDVARAGGVLVALAMGLALAFPTVPGTIAGFALAGFGIATVIPAAMHAADELPGLRAGTGLTIVSWLLRLGFLLMPPFVGLVADATSVRVGLLVVPAAGIVVAIAAGMLQGRRAGRIG